VITKTAGSGAAGERFSGPGFQVALEGERHRAIDKGKISNQPPWFSRRG
jgi:hypothetical protein